MGKLVDFVDKFESVIACRVSPKQKADIVEMIKAKYPRKTSLAIGDGANDVNMITTAHVGVGIMGLEGSQAARSSDFAISQFRFLKPLLFIHGREAYRRNAYLVLYNFYKNALFVLPQYWYGFLCGFSGQTLYEAFMYQMYNILYVSIPIIWYCIFDFEHEKGVFLKEPRLYRIGMTHSLFGTGKFWQWFLHGGLQAGFLMLLCFVSQGQTTYDGKPFDFWMSGQALYTCVVFLANAKILSDTHNFHLLGELVILSMLFCFLLSYYLMNLVPRVIELFGTFSIVMTAPSQMYLCLLLAASMPYTVDRMLATLL